MWPTQDTNTIAVCPMSEVLANLIDDAEEIPYDMSYETWHSLQLACARSEVRDAEYWLGILPAWRPGIAWSQSTDLDMI